jgi:fatty-acyl-CoA synthase
VSFAGANRDELSPLALLRRSAEAYPERPAVRDGARTLSFSEFADRAWRLAAALRLAGVDSDPDAAPFEHAVTCVVGGAPPSPTLIERCEAVGIRLVHMYGLTETYGPATVSAWPAEWDARPAEERAVLRARQGVPTALGGEVDVWDREGAPVPRDGRTMGEVVLRGNTVMAGYLDDSAATAEAFRGGWFHSGDAAVVYADGRVEYLLRERKWAGRERHVN